MINWEAGFVEESGWREEAHPAAESLPPFHFRRMDS